MTTSDFMRQRDDLETKRKALIQELVGKRRAIDEELRSIGHSESRQKPESSEKVCTECGERGHDARRHKAGRRIQKEASAAPAN